MSSLLEAAPGIALVLGIPGILVLLIVRVRLSWVQALAAVPVCSIGVVWLLAEITLITGLPFSPATFAVLLLALVVAAGISVARAGPRSVEPTIDSPGLDDSWTSTAVVVADSSASSSSDEHDLTIADRAPPAKSSDRVRMGAAFTLLVIALVLGGSIWIRGGASGRSEVPPFPDAANHGFMVARIIATESVEPKDVLVSDLRFGTKASDYYPLAMHAPLALAADITGASVASELLGITVLFGALVLPLGMFALTRRLVPDLPVAAGFAALFSQLIVAFPYKPFTWGGLTTIVAVAALPIVLVIVLRTITSGWSRRALALSTLLMMTVFGLYISVFVFLGFLLGLLLVERAWLAKSVRVLIPPVRRLAVIAAGTVFLALPVVVGLTSGVSERADATHTPLQQFDQAVGQVLTVGYLAPASRWLAGLAAIGIGLMLWRRRLAAWAVATGVICTLAVLAATSHGFVSQALTLPWYHQAERISFNLIYFVPVFAAIAIALVCEAIRVVVRRDNGFVVAGAVVVVAAVVWLTFGHFMEQVERQFLQHGYAADALVGDQQIAAFRFLGKHSPKHGLIVVDNQVDEAQWMYAYAGANPLWGIYPVGGMEKRLGLNFTERAYISQHLVALGSDPKLDSLLRKYDVRYVYLGEDTLDGWHHQWTLKQLRSVRRLREVVNRPGAHVFEILPPSDTTP